MRQFLTVVAPCYYPSTAYCGWLVDSCEKVGVKLHLYGIGKEWVSLFDGKVWQLQKEVQKLDTEYVMVVDAKDVIVLDDEATIIEKWTSVSVGASNRVLVSAEKRCWPQPLLEKEYMGYNSPWQFINSGCYIGSKDSILKLLVKMQNISWDGPLRSRDAMNDQFLLSLVFLSGYKDLQLDIHCKLFQTMGDAGPSELVWVNGRLVNLVKNTTPSVIHYNGNAEGIADGFYRRFSCGTCV